MYKKLLKNKINKIKYTNNNILLVILKLIISFDITSRFKIFISFLLSLLSGILESLSFTMIIPFILILISPKELLEVNIIKNYLPFLISISLEKLIFIIFIVLLLINIISTYLKIFLLKYTLNISADIGTYIARKTFLNLLNRDFIEFKSSSRAKDINLLTTQVNSTVGFISSTLFLLTSIIATLIILIATFLVSFQTTFLTIMIFIGLYLIIGKRANTKLSIIGTKQIKSSDQILKLINDGLGSFRSIILMDLGRFFEHKFSLAAKQYRYLNAETQYLQRYPKYSVELAAVITIASVSYYIFSSFESPTKALSLMSAIVFAIQKLLPNLQLVYASWARLISRKPMALNIINNIKAYKKDKSSSKISLKNKSKKKIFFRELVLESISFNYPNNSQTILKDINLTIKRGEFIGLIGKSGGGKSTLFDTMMGFVKPTRGRLLINGENLYKKIKNQNLYSWMKIITLVPQEIYLLDMSIAENIAFLTSKKDIDKTRIINICKTVELNKKFNNFDGIFLNKIGDNGCFLSGGEKQRLAIARSLYYGPEVLFLDEATSGLDPNVEKKVLLNLKKDYPELTIIMISHREEIIDMYDKTYVLEEKTLTLKKNN